MSLLDETDIQTWIDSHQGWVFENKGIEKRFEFNDFVAAFSFMTGVAILAEKANHHPEWSNVYHRVTIRLSTHDAGGVTEKDLSLGDQIDQIRS
ncbi:MAG: 4a-hydroxytetrahydrobiopterin dehydratase [Verrucomicrobiota bacterium]